MSTEYHVIDHHLDESVVDGEGNPAPVYRITVATPEEIHVPETDADGNLVLTEQKLMGSDGEPQKDINGNEIIMPGPPNIVKKVHYPVTEDFVFAADDERWQGKSPEDIAAEQRQIVKDALDQRERDARAAEEARERRQAMPGVGEAL